MTPKNLIVYRSSEELAKAAALLLAGALREILLAKDTCSFSLSGGTTPGPVYGRMADSRLAGELPLERVEVFFGDERCVPAHDPNSNYKMAKEAFGEVFSRFKEVHRIRGERDPSEAVEEYDALLRTPIDVQLLGMGPDAHIASIFPGSSAFASGGSKVAAVECPKPPPLRITVTPGVIRSAARTFVIVTGVGKSSALFDVFTKPGDPELYPAQLALEGTWLVDEAAACKLRLG